jgi:hypothetical protein
MAGWEIRKMNWVRKPSAWEYSQQIKQRRQELAQTYMDDAANLSSAFSTAMTSNSTGVAELAVKSAIDRMTKEAEAKKAAAVSSLNLFA